MSATPRRSVVYVHECCPDLSAISLVLWSLFYLFLWSGKLLNQTGPRAEPCLQQMQSLTCWDSVTVNCTPACGMISCTTGSWLFMRLISSTLEDVGYCWAVVSSAGLLGAALLSDKQRIGKISYLVVHSCEELSCVKYPEGTFRQKDALKGQADFPFCSSTDS